ncbi:MAG: YdcF family protein [Bacteroidetes bacterium]|nr:MAG: YdcF family protein [Bacteroidota bacterium]
MSRFFRRLLRTLLVVAVLGGLLFLLRKPIMRGAGHLLIKEDTPVQVDAAFVLSGQAYERSPKAMEVYERGLTPLVITTGSYINPSFEALGMDLPDAELGREALLRLGIDSAAVRTLSRGTSTWEESEEILGYSLREDFSRVMIISSRFHTRRLQSVFRNKFKSNGIDVVIQGADPVDYTIEAWWESEHGLIMVNNEYLKTLYYWLKY